MTKKRKIEILELMKEALKTHKHINGLCGSVCLLRYNEKITSNEQEKIARFIKSHRPKRPYNDVYYFKPYCPAPRIKWINERIKELQ